MGVARALNLEASTVGEGRMLPSIGMLHWSRAGGMAGQAGR